MKDAILVIDEDGDWRIDFDGKRGDKNLFNNEWLVHVEKLANQLSIEWPLRFKLTWMPRVNTESDV